MDELEPRHSPYRLELQRQLASFDENLAYPWGKGAKRSLAARLEYLRYAFDQWDNGQPRYLQRLLSSEPSRTPAAQRWRARSLAPLLPSQYRRDGELESLTTHHRNRQSNEQKR